jgi:hypothetical protein
MRKMRCAIGEYVSPECYHTYNMSKLTLSVDPGVAARAKRYAKGRGTSVSRMVEAYLTSVMEPETRKERTPKTPILDSLAGILKKADMGDYRKHLANKHR